MAIVGLDGHPIGPGTKKYEIGDFALETPKHSDFFLQQALQIAMQMMRSTNPAAASQVRNPFHMEPAAQAVFMMVAEKFAEQEERLASLEAKLESGSKGTADESSI